MYWHKEEKTGGKQRKRRKRAEQGGRREKRWRNRLSLNASPVLQLLFGFWFLFKLLLLLLTGLTFDLWLLLRLLFFCAPLNRLRNNSGKWSILWYATFYRWTTSFICLLKTSVSSWIFFCFQLDICDLLLVPAETGAVQLEQRCRIKPTATIQRLQNSSGTDFPTPDPPGNQLAAVLTTTLHWGHKHWDEGDAQQLTHPHTITYIHHSVG